MSETVAAKSLVLFDGVCNLCNSAVNFVIDRDPCGRFEFAPLQSAAATELLTQNGNAHLAELKTVVLVEDSRCYARSTAALRIARHLRGLGWLSYAGIVIPATIRDAVYDWIATHRYQWFGKLEACRMPTPEIAARFRE